MRTINVSYMMRGSVMEEEKTIKIPEADLVTLLIGLTLGGSVITAINTEGGEK